MVAGILCRERLWPELQNAETAKECKAPSRSKDMSRSTKKSLTRRSFIRTSAGAGAAVAAPYLGWKTTASGAAPSKDIRVASFGAAGRAFGDISSMMRVPGTTLVAVAEVDSNQLVKLNTGYADAKVYTDWRELLEKEEKHIDAVLVGTPDHMHAPISMSAMQLGKAVYCEKPLTRTLRESRALREYAAGNGIVTQMGNQAASGSGNKTAVKLLRGGVVGKVKSVHSMNPKSWGSMEPLPGAEEAVPASLDWDVWLGVGRERPYIGKEFHPKNWRKRIGYGTGTLGDMGCHIYHPWFMGLKARAPLSVVSLGPGPVDGDSWPIDAKVRYVFPGNDLSGGKSYEMTWYDGAQFPPGEVAEAVGGMENIPKSGSVVIGTEGALVIPHGGNAELGIYRDGVRSDEEFKSPRGTDHHGTFADAIRGDGKAPISNFSYSGWMTEAVLLGTVALRLPGEKLQWDAKKMRFNNSKKASAMVGDTYREGWEVEGL